MKILFISAYFWPFEVGGAERSLRLLMSELRHQGIDSSVVTLARDHSLPQVDEVDGFRVYRIVAAPGKHSYDVARRCAIGKLGWHLVTAYGNRYQKELNAILALERPSWVHISALGGFSPKFFSSIQKEGIRLGVSCRDYSFVCPRNTLLTKRGEKTCRDPLLNRLITRPRREMLRSADGAVANSIRTRDLIQKKLGRGLAQFHVIYTSKPNAVDSSFTIPRSFKRGLVIGALSAAKGIDRLLATLSLLDVRISWEFAGAGPLERELQSYCARSPDSRFIGSIDGDEKELAFARCDFVLVPSYWEEPYPRVVWEAFARRRLVIASRVGGIPEMLKNGHYGYLFDWNGSVSLPTVLKQVSKAPERAVRKIENAAEFVGQPSRTTGEDYALFFRGKLGTGGIDS